MIPAPRERTFELEASDGARLHCFSWGDDDAPAGIVQIAHGMGEHAGRYRRLAAALVDAGYLVLASDHRGHGQTAGSDRLGRFGDDGWNRVVRDAFELAEHARRYHPRGPRVLLGHSMGAMLGQQYVYRYGHTLDALVLSGTPGFAQPLKALATRLVAFIERLRLGNDAVSPLLEKLVFGDANKPFEGSGATTGFEWLSRDDDEVRRYVGDPFCGFVLCNGALSALFRGAWEARLPGNVATVPSLPIYLISGGDDPVHDGWRNIDRLVAAYRSAGTDVEVRRYDGGRHELFNEINRDEVTADLLGWLERSLRRSAGAESSGTRYRPPK